MKNKYRHELKFVVDEIDLRVIEKRLSGIMRHDSHADSNGQYIIRSVYFDDANRTAYYENQNGNDPRHKFRVRIYNYSDERITLEKKIKNNGMTAKQSCSISREQYYRMISGDNMMDQLGESPLFDEWILWNNSMIVHPVMLGEYVRTPYIYEPGNVRVTFDKFISASRDYDRLFNKDIMKIEVVPDGRHVLEVKYDELLPDIVKEAVDIGNLQRTGFSKFYLGVRALEGSLDL